MVETVAVAEALIALVIVAVGEEISNIVSPLACVTSIVLNVAPIKLTFTVAVRGEIVGFASFVVNVNVAAPVVVIVGLTDNQSGIELVDHVAFDVTEAVAVLLAAFPILTVVGVIVNMVSQGT